MTPGHGEKDETSGACANTDDHIAFISKFYSPKSGRGVLMVQLLRLVSRITVKMVDQFFRYFWWISESGMIFAPVNPWFTL